MNEDEVVKPINELSLIEFIDKLKMIANEFMEINEMIPIEKIHRDQAVYIIGVLTNFGQDVRGKVLKGGNVK